MRHDSSALYRHRIIQPLVLDDDFLDDAGQVDLFVAGYLQAARDHEALIGSPDAVVEVEIPYSSAKEFDAHRIAAQQLRESALRALGAYVSCRAESRYKAPNPEHRVYRKFAAKLLDGLSCVRAEYEDGGWGTFRIWDDAGVEIYNYNYFSAKGLIYTVADIEAQAVAAVNTAGELQRHVREFNERVMDMFDRFDTRAVNGSKDAKYLLKLCDGLLSKNMIGISSGTISNTRVAEWKAEERRAKS